VLSGIGTLASDKMRLQGHCLNPGISQRLRSAGRGRKAFYLVTCRLSAFAYHG
jgi:hypothetical protein